MDGKPMIKSYKELIVWQKSVELSMYIYQCSKNFPRDELFGLRSQMRRSAVSIPSNIAEGRCRGTRKDFSHFLRIALGSCGELETQVIIAKKLKYIINKDYELIDGYLIEISKMLNSMIKKL